MVHTLATTMADGLRIVTFPLPCHPLSVPLPASRRELPAPGAQGRGAVADHGAAALGAGWQLGDLTRVAEAMAGGFVAAGLAGHVSSDRQAERSAAQPFGEVAVYLVATCLVVVLSLHLEV